MPAPEPSPPLPRRPSPAVRAARRRADRAKLVVVALATVVFAAGLGLARSSYASHPKHRSQPLAAPPRFESIVQAGTTGVVAPPRAPEAVQSATS